ncbi:MAG: hypothetical protein WAU78_00230 [Roseiarcus sp.]|jgi:hypothetical protein
MSKHPQNGPTFSKAPPKKHKPLTDQELAERQGRKDATVAETIRVAAKTRKFNQLLRKDPMAALAELGLPKNSKEGLP